MIPVKRRRGRPRKNEITKVDPSITAIASAVDSATLKNRPARTTKKLENDDIYVETNEEGDDDYIPGFEDLVVELDEPEIAHKARKSHGYKRTKTNGSRSNTPSSTLEEKGRVVRALKDLSSARDKIERIYGLNKQKLLNLAKVKEGFETCVFCFPSENLRKDSPYFVDLVPPCASENVYRTLVGMNRTKFHVMSESEMGQMIQKRSKPLQVVIGETEISLGVDDKADFPVFENDRRTGFLYNTGALITDLAWLTQEHEESQYLAVSLSQYMDKPSDEHLKMFEAEGNVSCIEIYKLHPHTLAFTKLQTIVHTFGETWNLKWHEGCQSESSIGSLVFICHDGSVKMLEVENTQEFTVKLIDQPSLCIELPRVAITCYDFLSPTTIICGFKNGYVGEFDLSDPTTPSYYRKIHDSYVISIIVAYSEFENLLVSTVAVDGYFYVFDPKDIFTSKTTITRFRGTNIIPMAYIPQLYAIVNSDGANSLKAVVPRAAFAIHSVCSLENSIVSIGTSRLHPLSLSGSSDGSVVIDNVARRLVTGIKNTAQTHTSLRLWKWEYSELDEKYRLNHAYETFKLSVNEVIALRIDPHGVNISCIKWCESTSSGQFYAFANNAGILTIEKLGT
ncbi:hypothetical protein HG537_0E00870 [Torulaspora globosa]|uniref:Transcription factor tau 91 kDa subunit n=1 Tax=Torulaspora globosa TaxID=48254 RepID=A0A7H9HSM3_9SACH|nr:hypothetical protein HG537_0E00870 [Torulaspora sp. CBS 2947]